MLCIVSVLPLLIIGSLTENELLLVAMLALLMLIAGVAAAIFIVVGIQHASMQRLLQEGEFTKKEKARTGVREVVGLSYWGVLTAVFLVVSFLTNAWHLSWLIFAVGGVLFPVVMCICNYFADRNKQD